MRVFKCALDRRVIGIDFAAMLSSLQASAHSPADLRRAEQSGGQQAAVLSEAEARFGVSPKLDKRVTYQPDVIVMEHGAEAIRSQGADGFTWTIDGAAQGASQVEPDKIMFATGRAVGRVLKVVRKG